MTLKYPSKPYGGDKSAGTTITEQVADYVEGIFPNATKPAWVAEELGIKRNTAGKCLRRLVKSGRIQHPPGKSDEYYMAPPTVYNVANLERPEVKIHGVVYTYELDSRLSGGDRKGDSPISLYTAEDTRAISRQPSPKNRITEHFTIDNIPYRVQLQFEKSVVVVYTHASKHQLNPHQFGVLDSLVYGYLKALGVSVDVCKSEVRKFELAKDHELIQVTNQMLTIQDLKSPGLIRWYQKYRNVMRMEVATTWEGQKAIHEMFNDFGTERLKSRVKGVEPGTGGSEV